MNFEKLGKRIRNPLIETIVSGGDKSKSGELYCPTIRKQRINVIISHDTLHEDDEKLPKGEYTHVSVSGMTGKLTNELLDEFIKECIGEYTLCDSNLNATHIWIREKGNEKKV